MNMATPPMAVLLIEDDPALRQLVDAVLRRKGLAVEAFSRGDAAVTEIESRGNRYGAIVLDLMLPGLNGFGILDRIRKSRPDLLSRIIVLTAVSTSVLSTLSFSPLVWRVMRKPFDLHEFLGVTFECTDCHTGRTVPAPGTVSNWFERKSAMIGATGGVLAVARSSALDLRATFGFSNAMTDQIFPIALDQRYPLTTAYRKAESLCYPSLSLAREDYPHLLPIWTSGSTQAIAAVPIGSADHTIGSMGWTFDTPDAFDDGRRDALARISSESFGILSRSE